MSVRIEKITIKASLPQGENPLPYFRAPHHDMLVCVKENVGIDYQKLMGLDCGYRVLPYSVQDRYDTNRVEQEIEAVVMENEFLKFRINLARGGVIDSAIYK
ncbi:MAG: hypothetical protein EOM67_07335, partial [Spirochaetia bacterium]|nr:hypothetical protein [Spirochaetia bacterium]